MRRARVAAAATATAAALVVSAPAFAARPPAAVLAARYAPVLHLVPNHACGTDEPYVPIDVGLLFGEPTVALRGPWGADLITIAPTARRLARGLYEYHLDFPGTALSPGCSYLRWQQRLTQGHRPVTYARVATDPAFPGRLALQYWFFYVFNDWNNLHEGDWEMIQLDFEASTAAEALRTSPVEVGYSQHEGAERAGWGDQKLELVDGTHPVVYPADGSHANFFGSALYLGASASEGVGCDDTRGATDVVRPVVRIVPTGAAAATRQYPWLAFQGRWGEARPAFFNGPTGPNLKEQWRAPIEWSESWRKRSVTVPAASAFGPGATGFFCGAASAGSIALVRVVHHPFGTGLVLTVLAVAILVLLARATWRPSAPLRVAARRTWGQVLTASGRMYAAHAPLFIAVGVVLIPISLAVSLLQALLVHATSIMGVQSGGSNDGLLALLVLAASTALTLFGIGLVQAAVARAIAEIDQGRDVDARRVYRLAWRVRRPLFHALLVAAVVVTLLATSLFGLPIAVWLAGRWALVAPVVEFERTSGLGALRRSSRLVRGHWLKVASLIVAGALVVVAAGPAVGVILILATDAPLWLVNLVAGVVYAVAMPFVALTTAYAYFDARTRVELAGERETDTVPAEIDFAT